MITKSTLQHIRLPFSYFLMPVYIMAIVFTPHVEYVKALIIFVVLHVFLFTSSNGFNTYFDKDSGSIGGIKKPLPVTPDLLWVALALDAFAVLLGLMVSVYFAVGCFIYGIVSKMYSWDKIRIKKYALTSWIITGLGQGLFIFLLVASSLTSHPTDALINVKVWIPGILTGMFMLGFYPLSQIYQHDEDEKRGDYTISLLLGVRGTFMLSLIAMASAFLGYVAFFLWFFGTSFALIFTLVLLPAVCYFVFWMVQSYKNSGYADYTRTMRMCFLSATGFLLFGILNVFILKK